MLLCAQDAVESKKRETMLVGLKQTQGQVGVLEESLTRVQLELERISFALQAKTGAVGFRHLGWQFRNSGHCELGTRPAGASLHCARAAGV